MEKRQRYQHPEGSLPPGDTAGTPPARRPAFLIVLSGPLLLQLSTVFHLLPLIS